MRRIAIAIDGFSGCGKSSTAKAVANALSYTYIDSGAMYRGVTHLISQMGISINDIDGIKVLLDRMQLNFRKTASGEPHLFNGDSDLEPHLRTMDVNRRVSEVSTLADVRTSLVYQQQQLGKKGGIVMDGRDIGTVVFPDADLKLFLTADVQVRARRRMQELETKGISATLDEIIKNFQDRDKLDSEREISPLRKAEDAIELDTSFLTFDEQINKVLNLAEERIYAD